MAAIYCTVDDVANILGHPDGFFDVNSTPSSTTITKFIERAQDKIDSTTAHAWRETTVTNEYIDPSSIYRYGTGIRFDLTHRSIKQFSSGSGDKIEVWDGSSWVDYVATKTEGRNKDYWVDYENGSIFLMGTFNLLHHGFRVTYRYGESTVSNSINEACAMMAAISVLNSPEYAAISFTDDGGSNRQTDSARIEYWKDTIKNILENNTEFQVF
jgi:hypothetical protein